MEFLGYELRGRGVVEEEVALAGVEGGGVGGGVEEEEGGGAVVGVLWLG